MERDFMGSSSKIGHVDAKEEASDEANNNSATQKSSAMEWSFSNKVSAIPQFLSFKGPQEDRPRRNGHDTSTFMTISSADPFHSRQKPFSGVLQKNFYLDKQAGNPYTMTVYPMQHFDAHLGHRSQEVNIYPAVNEPNQRIPVALNAPVVQSLPSVGKNMAGSSLNMQSMGGVQVMAPASVLPSKSSLVGTTDLRNVSKVSGAPAQLTIFYTGSVNVYDDISPEKAQAIMLLAGNGSSPNQFHSPSIAQVQAPRSTASPADAFFGNQSHVTSSISRIPRPLPVTSFATSRSLGAFSSSNEVSIVKPVGTSAYPIDLSEPSNVVSSAGSAMTTLIPTVPVPQARKASLARFFEKRKERMMNTLPYDVSRKSSDCSTPRSQGVILSFNSSGPCAPQAIN